MRRRVTENKAPSLELSQPYLGLLLPTYLFSLFTDGVKEIVSLSSSLIA